MSRIVRTSLLTLILTTSATLRGDVPVSASDRPAGALCTVGQNYGVRLRKLHLVRPDLIPYPLSLEVYC